MQPNHRPRIARTGGTCHRARNTSASAQSGALTAGGPEARPAVTVSLAAPPRPVDSGRGVLGSPLVPASPTSAPAETTPGRDPELVGGRAAARTARSPDFRLRGDVVGRYVVLDKIGAGGMGIVYAAYDPELDRKIALKLLRPGASGRAEIARARLLREAQALARLNHPGVIAVHDVGTFEEQVFIAMEFVDGVDAAQWVASARKSWREVLPIWRQAGEGIAAAHAAGVVHRDLKPENVLIGNDGRVRVLDFGLARTEVSDPTSDPAMDRSSDGEGSERPSSRMAESTTRLTQAGAVMGTPAYMAPEQHTGGPIDARTDQFSFCVALYEALYGERPFAGERAPEIAFNVVRGRVREPSREGPTVPAWLRKVIVRGLATAPDERWPDMRALLAALAADPAARQQRIALAALGFSALGAAGLLLSTLRPDEEVCRGAERKLEAIWDDGVRDRVRVAFSQSSRPYADDAFASTSQMLDGHTADFVRLHRDACEATAIRKEQSQEMLDRQVACLERRLKDVRALTRLLVGADDDAVTQAVTAAAALPSFEPCADRQALMSPGAPPTGALAEELAAVHDQLAAVRQQIRLARYVDALGGATAAVASAREIGHGATIGEALVLLGSAQAQMGDRTAAERTFREASWSADEAGDDITRADASGHLVWVLASAPDRADEVDGLAEAASRTLRRAGGDALIEATLQNNVGVAARRRGATSAAIAAHERALDLRRQHLGADDPAIADSLLNLGSSLADADRFDEAERALGEAERIVRARYGDRHPRVASALHSHGIVSYRRGDFGAAALLLAAATRIREDALPAGHPDLANSRHDLGEVLLAAGRHDAALEQFTAAVALREAAAASHPAALANSLRGRGLAELALGRVDDARRSLQRAVELRAAGADLLARAETEFAYAGALVHTERSAALGLARAAREAYAAAGDTVESARIDAWLAEHAGPR